MKPAVIKRTDSATLSARLQTAEGLEGLIPDYLRVWGLGPEALHVSQVLQIKSLGGYFDGPIGNTVTHTVLPPTVESIEFIAEFMKANSAGREGLTVHCLHVGQIVLGVNLGNGEDPFEIIRQWYIVAATPGTRLHNHLLDNLERDEEQRVKNSVEYRTWKRHDAIRVGFEKVCSIITEDDFTPEQRATLVAMRDEARACRTNRPIENPTNIHRRYT